MIEITARQIGGLIHICADYIKTLKDIRDVAGMPLTIGGELNLMNAEKLMKEINDLQPKRIENDR